MKNYRRPKWIAEGIISVGAWEPLINRKRSGRASVEEVELYKAEHSEETVKKLAEIGVNTIITAYYKGLGFEVEKPDMEYARQLVRRAHKHGLKVGLYIRWDNIITESILNEVPRARNWLRIDQDGNIPGYDYYRHFICFNCKAYEDYLKKIVAYAIEHVKGDMILFDGGSFGGEGGACHCQRCRKGFTAFLKKKYGRKPKIARERFGFSGLSHVQPPTIVPQRPLHTITTVRDPVRQEWMEFRCRSFTDFHHRMSRYVKKLNPEVAMLLNCGVNSTATNGAFYAAVDLPSIASENDVIFDENHEDPYITDDGVLVSHIPHYKMGRAVNNLVISYQSRCRSARQTTLSIAEAMTFNQQTLGEMSGGFSAFLEDCTYLNEKKMCIQFFNQHKQLYRDSDVLTNVAVWSSAKSLSLNNVQTHQGLALAVQTLSQGHVPFDFVLDGDLADLSKYDVLVLPDVESMSTAEIGLVEDYVKAGGGVVATEKTSQFDEWHRRRSRGGLFGILDEVQAAEDIVVFDESGRRLTLAVTTGKGADKAEIRHQVGKGRFAYINEIIRPEPMISYEPHVWHGHANSARYWRLPKNYRQWINAVKWASRNRLPIETSAPTSVIVEPLKQRSHNLILVHMLNYDLKGKAPRNIKVSLRLPADSSCKTAKQLELGKKAKPLTTTKTQGKLSFVVPKLDVYGVVAVELYDSDV